MRTLSIAMFALATVVPASAKTFEGIVYYTMTTGKHTSQSEYAIKGQRVKTTTVISPTRSTEGIYDAETGEAFIIMRAQGMYMRFGGMNEMAAALAGDDTQVEKTGETESIAGYRCQKYVITDTKSVVELWATKDLGSYVSFAEIQSNKGKNAGWVNFLLKEKLFPLKTVTKDRRGRVRVTMVADKVEAGKLDPAPFELPPPGLNEFSIPGLGDLLKGIGGG